MATPKNSDANLEARLLEKTQKLLITKAVSGDFRLAIEKSFADDSAKILSRVMRILSTMMKDGGYLQLFSRQARLINMSFTRQRDRRREFNSVIREQLFDLLDFLYTLSERRAFQRVHRLHTRMAYEYGAVTALRSMGFGARSERLENFERELVKKAPLGVDEVIEFGLSDEEILFWLESGTIASGTTLGVVAIESARKTIADNMVLGNLGIDEVAEKIASSLDVTDWKALQIARTETQVAFNSAMNDQYVRSKVGRRQWITVGDRRVRPAHVTNEAVGWVEYPNAFPNGAMHPGEGPDSINCRCSIQADLSDPSTLIQPWEGQPMMLEPEVALPPKAPRMARKPRPKVTAPRPSLPRPKPDVKPARVPSAPDAEPPSIGGKMPTTADGINDELQTIADILEGPWGQDEAFKKSAKKRMANLRAKKKRIMGVRPVTADVDAPKPSTAPAEPVKPEIPSGGFPSTIDDLEFVQDLGGSTGAKLVRDPQTDVRYVLKRGANADHLRSEYLTEQLYRQAGVKIPKSFLYEVDGVPVKLSEFVEDAIDLQSLKLTDLARYKKAVAKIEKDFATDAVLGNWDVVGMSMDNILVGADDVAWRVDVGGALRYRAQGDLKDVFSPNVTELWSLSRPDSRYSAWRVFGDTSWKKKVRSIERTVKRRAKVLAKIDDPALRQRVSERFDSLEDTLFHHKKFKEAGWKDDYSGRVMMHRVQMKDEGVFAGMPDELFGSSSAKSLDVRSIKDSPASLLKDDNFQFFQQELPGRIATYTDKNGGSNIAWSSWADAQGGSSWSDWATINKHWTTTQRVDGNKGWWWRNREKAWKRQIKDTYGLEVWENTMAINHAANYDMLTNVKMYNNDAAKGVVRICRTESETTMRTYFDKLFSGTRNMERGIAESGSIFRDFYYLGDTITVQEVEHANVIGTFLIQKTGGYGRPSATFAGIRENEFVCIFKSDIPFAARPYGELPSDWMKATFGDTWKAGNLEDSVWDAHGLMGAD